MVNYLADSERMSSTSGQFVQPQMIRSRRLLVGLFVLSFSGCSPSPSKPPVSAPKSATPRDHGEDWIPITSHEGGFSAKFPVNPVEKESTTPAGIQKRQVVAVIDQGQLVYSVQYGDGPPPSDIPQTLAQAQAGMIEALGGSLVEEAEIHLGNWAGRAFSFTFNVRAGPGISIVRTYLVGHRVYILSVTGHPDRVNDQDAQRFFESFSLLEK